LVDQKEAFIMENKNLKYFSRRKDLHKAPQSQISRNKDYK
jgi:hypothetical protein